VVEGGTGSDKAIPVQTIKKKLGHKSTGGRNDRRERRGNRRGSCREQARKKKLRGPLWREKRVATARGKDETAHPKCARGFGHAGGRACEGNAKNARKRKARYWLMAGESEPNGASLLEIHEEPRQGRDPNRTARMFVVEKQFVAIRNPSEWAQTSPEKAGSGFHLGLGKSREPSEDRARPTIGRDSSTDQTPGRTDQRFIEAGKGPTGPFLNGRGDDTAGRC